MIRAHHILVPAALVLPIAAVVGAPPPPAPVAPPAFARCTACHAVDRGGVAEIGPNLWGVYGARAAGRPGFAYSAALKKTGLRWDKATLGRWLDNGQKVAPGTTMPNQGLKPAERDAIVAYLQKLK